MKKSKNKFKKYIINILLIGIIASIVTWIIIEKYQENQIETDKYNIQIISAKQGNNAQTNQKKANEKLTKEVEKCEN